jgi:hypothetical protein
MNEERDTMEVPLIYRLPRTRLSRALSRRASSYYEGNITSISLCRKFAIHSPEIGIIGINSGEYELHFSLRLTSKLFNHNSAIEAAMLFLKAAGS